jgi:hypothetical protein
MRVAETLRLVIAASIAISALGSMTVTDGFGGWDA